jgi:hypothetical protein
VKKPARIGDKSDVSEFLRPYSYQPFRIKIEEGDSAAFPAISAESLGAACEQRARRWRKQGQRILAAEEKEQAKFWRQFRCQPEEYWSQFYRDFYKRSGQPLTVLAVRAQSDSKAATLLKANALILLSRIAQLAETGNVESIDALIKIAHDATFYLNRFVVSIPRVAEYAGHSARRMKSWPILKSPKPAWGDHQTELFKKLNVGLDYPFLNDPGARAKHHDLAGRIATQLWGHTEFARMYPQLCCAAWASETASLPAFTKETAAEWWRVARFALLEGYPQPQEDRTLRQLVTAKSKQKSPGRMRSRILQVLKQRFESLAPKQR